MMIPELNGGFEFNCDSNERPLLYTKAVPGEGNYLVEIEFQSSLSTEEIYLFLNRRKLCFHGFGNKTHQVHRTEGLVNVCPTIPRGYTEVMESNNINVSLIGKGLELLSVTITPWVGRTIHIAGDSTVTDQTTTYPYYPAGSYCGWGQMLQNFLNKDFCVSNYAHSGLTTESFCKGKYYQLMRDHIKKDDICLFQFGHNDQKLPYLQPALGYRDNICRYIEETLQLSAIPVLVTPISKNGWRAGSVFNDLLVEYSEICKQVAAQYGIPIVQLHDLTAEFVKNQGMEHAKNYYFPSDFTHTNDFGGYLYASYVYEELIRYGICERHEYQPWIPDENALKKLPHGFRPRNALAEDYFDKIERGGDIITRAECLQLAAAAMRFSLTNVYNDRYSDVLGHETYAGIIETAYENGFIPSELEENGKIFPEKKANGDEFLKILLNALSCRKSLDIHGKTTVESAQLLDILPNDFKAEKLLTRADAAAMCKKVHI